MNYMYLQLREEEQQLQELFDKLSAQLRTAPEGKLEISSRKGYDQYYLCENDKERSRKKRQYIRMEDKALAGAIAQRDYARRLLHEVEKRLKTIRAARKVYGSTAPENVLLSYTKARQKLISPMILTDEEYIRQWLAEEYQGRFFAEETPEIYTNKGERVRSKSEKIIADALERYAIPYKYEDPLMFSDGVLMYPDFRVLNVDRRKEYIWEHLGMMDSDAYVSNTVDKINRYIRDGFLPGKKLILTMENGRFPLSTKIIEKTIKTYLC